MHVPDGFLDLATSIATASVAAVGVAAALRGARRDLDDAVVPLAGLTSVFVFAGQMVNFPVGAGTSGHLLGGALAALLVGPWTATLAVTVVLGVQALLFADGGITALGTNVVLLAVVAPWVAWWVWRGLRPLVRRVLPGAGGVSVLAFISGLVSVLAAAGVFVLLYLLGGVVPIDTGALVASMLGWHAVIGVAEGVITALVVGAVLAVRPDLVHAVRGERATGELEMRTGVIR